MLKSPIYILLIILSLIGCTNNEEKLSYNDQVIALQKESQEIYNNPERAQDSILIVLNKAKFIISREKIADTIIAENHFYLAKYFHYSSKNIEIDSALVNYTKAIEISGDKIHYSDQLSYFYQNWLLFLDQEKWSDCVELIKKYEAMLDQNPSEGDLSFLHYLWSETFSESGDYKKAIKYNEKRIKYLEEVNDTIYINNAYITLSQIKYDSGDKQGAFNMLDSLLTREKKTKFDTNRMLFGQYGVLLYKEKNYQQAIPYFKKSIEYIKLETEIPNTNNFLANSYGNIVASYIEINKYIEAEKHLDSIKILDINSLNFKNKKNILEYELSIAYETGAKKEEILKYLERVDSVQNIAYQQKTDTELVALTEVNNKKEELLLKQQETELKNLKLTISFGIAIGAAFLLTAIGLLLYKQRTIKFEKKNLLMNQRLLRSQMNPHFTFNTLYLIQNKIEKDPKKASEYLLSFSRMLRLIFENSTSNFIEFEKEMELLEQYLTLQLLRFPDKFNYTIDISSLKEIDMLLVPPMLIQPFVENSIEHGFNKIDYKGNINISFKIENSFLRCVISDNGRGFNVKLAKSKKTSSTKLISEYIEKVTKSGVTYTQNTNSADKGITVSFLVPFK